MSINLSSQLQAVNGGRKTTAMNKFDKYLNMRHHNNALLKHGSES